MPDIERRFTPMDKATIEMRDDEGEDGASHIIGHAAVYYDGTRDTEFEIWDGLFERVMPGAFDDTLADGDEMLGLFNHDPDNILGRRSAKTLSVESDKTGLAYDITRGHTTVANDVAEHISRGDLTGSSFAFRVSDERWVEEDGREIREINKAQVYDVGPVTFPAYTATDTGIRGGDCSEGRASYAAWKESQKRTSNPELLLLDIEIESAR